MTFVQILVLIIAFILLIAGLIGCFVPVIPGPPLSFIGICLVHLSRFAQFSIQFFIVFGLLTAAVTIADYLFPVWGTKKFGGSKAGTWGATIGLIVGIFIIPPVGIIIGTFAGALIGELIAGNTFGKAFKASIGSFLGFLVGTVMKLVISGLMLFYAVTGLF